jgi:hypothetical protein
MARCLQQEGGQRSARPVHALQLGPIMANSDTIDTRRHEGTPRSLVRLGEIARNSGLSIVFLLLFVVAIAGQFVAGFGSYNEERLDEGAAPVTFGQYVVSGHALEATFENWESEFLQMGLFVLLTVKLYQRGSSESKEPGKKHESDEDPRKHKNGKDAPWPVRRGGLVLKLYEHSLSAALILLFLVTFVLHAWSGHAKAADAAQLRGVAPETFGEFVRSSEFWFESLQNWQSEFLSVFAIVVLSIFLRERGSPQSKPVAAPHHETGG